MVSLRFPGWFWQPQSQRVPPPHSSSRPFSSFAAAVGVTAGAFAAISSSHENALKFLFSSDRSLPLWGSLSLADNSVPVVESKTGASFPSVLEGSQKLCGIGLRKKSILGLKNIDVYAFGVYADNNDIKKYLVEKYGTLSASQLKGNKEFTEDLLENDISMTIRLQIVYSKLSIRSVRSAFEESVGIRLQKYGGSDNNDLLQRFTSQFKDEFKIPRGSVIHLSREKGHVLRTSSLLNRDSEDSVEKGHVLRTNKGFNFKYLVPYAVIPWRAWLCVEAIVRRLTHGELSRWNWCCIDGQEVGSIQSKVLCRSILDLYIGEEPFDKQAKEDIELNMASYLQN